jgi:hypothetical protein
VSDLINDEQQLNGAKYLSGYEISVYDDGFGPLWISRNSIGTNGVVRARTWEDAYSICEDEFFLEATETMDEIVKEYGSEWIENACFQEAFGFRNNGANIRDVIGHGIYSKDMNGDCLDLLTAEMVADLGIVLDITEQDGD